MLKVYPDLKARYYRSDSRTIQNLNEIEMWFLWNFHSKTFLKYCHKNYK